MFFGSYLITSNGTLLPSNYKLFGGFQISISFLKGGGLMTAIETWLNLGIYLKLSYSDALDTLNSHFIFLYLLTPPY